MSLRNTDLPAPAQTIVDHLRNIDRAATNAAKRTPAIRPLATIIIGAVRSELGRLNANPRLLDPVVKLADHGIDPLTAYRIVIPGADRAALARLQAAGWIDSPITTTAKAATRWRPHVGRLDFTE